MASEEPLASCSAFLPLQFASPVVSAAQSGGSIAKSCSAHSTGSRALRPGDWRLAAAAETGGGPVHPPGISFMLPTDNTPNIDDVHSPASTYRDGASQCRSNGGTPLSLSPLQPRNLEPATNTTTWGASNAKGAAAFQFGNLPVQASIDFDAGVPANPAPNCEPSLNWCAAESPDGTGGANNHDVDNFDVNMQPEAGGESPALSPAPRGRGAALRRAGSMSDGELSTPGSGGYNSPAVGFGVLQQAASVRSSVANNPLFDLDRPVQDNADPIVRTLVLSPRTDPPASRRTSGSRDQGWSSNGSSPASRKEHIPVAATPTAAAPSTAATAIAATTPVASGIRSKSKPPLPSTAASPLLPLPTVELETPRRSIKSLSAMLSNAASGVASRLRSPSGREGASVSRAHGASGTPVSGALQHSSAMAPSRAAGAVAATPCSRNAAAKPQQRQQLPSSTPTRTVPTRGEARGSTSPAEAAGGRSPASSSSKISSGSTGSPAQDDTGGCRRGLDQTPRKSGKQQPQGAKLSGVVGGSGKAKKKGQVFGAKQDRDAGVGAGGAAQHAQAEQVPAQEAAAAARAGSGNGGMRATAWHAVSWLLLLALCVGGGVVLMREGPVVSAPESTAFALGRLGPVCFPERYPAINTGATKAPVQVVVSVARPHARPARFLGLCWPSPPHTPWLDQLLRTRPAWPPAPHTTLVTPEVAPSATEELLAVNDTVQQGTAAPAPEPMAEETVAAVSAAQEVAPFVERVEGAAMDGPAMDQPLAAAAEEEALAAAVVEERTAMAPATCQPAPLIWSLPVALPCVVVEPVANSNTDSSCGTLEMLTSPTVRQQVLAAAAPPPQQFVVVEPSVNAEQEALSSVVIASPSKEPSAAVLGHAGAAAGPVSTTSEITPAAPVPAERKAAPPAARRYLGWTPTEVLLGCVAACATGALLAVGVERVLQQQVAAADKPRAGVGLTCVEEEPAGPADVTPAKAITREDFITTPTTRILHLKAPPPTRGATPAQQPTPGSGTPAAGRYVWQDNRLVYVEGL